MACAGYYFTERMQLFGDIFLRSGFMNADSVVPYPVRSAIFLCTALFISGIEGVWKRLKPEKLGMILKGMIFSAAERSFCLCRFYDYWGLLLSRQRYIIIMTKV